MYGRILQHSYAVLAGAGTSFGLIPPPGQGFVELDAVTGLPTKATPLRGRLLGVNVRVPTGGGWTFSSLQTVIFQASPLLGMPTSYPFDDAIILYKSSISTAITPSNSDSVFNDDIGINEQWFGGWLGFAHSWATSAGAGTSGLVTSLHVALNEDS